MTQPSALPPPPWLPAPPPAPAGSGFLGWVRSEPVMIGAVILAIATEAITLHANQGIVGTSVAVAQLILAAIVRQNVVPTATLDAVPHG